MEKRVEACANERGAVRARRLLISVAVPVVTLRRSSIFCGFCLNKIVGQARTWQKLIGAESADRRIANVGRRRRASLPGLACAAWCRRMRACSSRSCARSSPAFAPPLARALSSHLNVCALSLLTSSSACFVSTVGASLHPFLRSPLRAAAVVAAALSAADIGGGGVEVKHLFFSISSSSRRRSSRASISPSCSSACAPPEMPRVVLPPTGELRQHRSRSCSAMRSCSAVRAAASQFGGRGAATGTAQLGRRLVRDGGAHGGLKRKRSSGHVSGHTRRCGGVAFDEFCVWSIFLFFLRPCCALFLVSLLWHRI